MWHEYLLQIISDMKLCAKVPQGSLLMYARDNKREIEISGNPT